MKTIFSLLALAATSAAVFASAGPGPWANATYYPGNLDGKYQAAVYGNNISGVLGFALNNGSPTIATNSTVTSSNSTQSTIVVDPFQNYFAIFVEGRTYTGYSMANANYDNNTVTGSLIGAQPDFTIMTNSFDVFSTNSEVTSDTVEVPIYLTNVTTTFEGIGSSNVVTTNLTPVTNTITTNTIVIIEDPISGNIYQTNTYITNVVTTVPTLTTNVVNLYRTNYNTNVTTSGYFTNSFLTNPVISTLTSNRPTFDPTALLNRVLNGGFRARINGDGGVFTFSGNGDLSTPAQFQTVVFTTNAAGDVIGAQVDTDTVPFQLDGIRVSFTTTP